MRLFGRATRTLQLLKTVTNTADARHYAGKTPQTPGGGRADVAPPNHTEPPHSVAGVGGAVKLCDSRRLTVTWNSELIDGLDGDKAAGSGCNTRSRDGEQWAQGVRAGTNSTKDVHWDGPADPRPRALL